MTIQCPACGAKHDNSEVSCAECGEDLDVRPTTVQVPPKPAVASIRRYWVYKLKHRTHWAFVNLRPWSYEGAVAQICRDRGLETLPDGTEVRQVDIDADNVWTFVDEEHDK